MSHTLLKHLIYLIVSKLNKYKNINFKNQLYISLSGQNICNCENTIRSQN